MEITDVVSKMLREGEMKSPFPGYLSHELRSTAFPESLYGKISGMLVTALGSTDVHVINRGLLAVKSLAEFSGGFQRYISREDSFINKLRNLKSFNASEDPITGSYYITNVRSNATKALNAIFSPQQATPISNIDLKSRIQGFGNTNYVPQDVQTPSFPSSHQYTPNPYTSTQFSTQIPEKTSADLIKEEVNVIVSNHTLFGERFQRFVADIVANNLTPFSNQFSEKEEIQLIVSNVLNLYETGHKFNAALLLETLLNVLIGEKRETLKKCLLSRKSDLTRLAAGDKVIENVLSIVEPDVDAGSKGNLLGLHAEKKKDIETVEDLLGLAEEDTKKVNTDDMFANMTLNDSTDAKKSGFDFMNDDLLG